MTARIALLGDSGVGKTGLGWRIAKGEFREHPSTHGQQFWVVPELTLLREDGTQCEAVLWDLAGQPDYRLVHALFLDQVDLGLLLMDATDRERPLSGVEYWINHLRYARERKAIEGDNGLHRSCPPMLLVAARVDRGSPTLTRAQIDEFCIRNGIDDYLETSAKDNTGVANLLQRIKRVLPWNTFSTIVTTRTFKRIKDCLLALKQRSTYPHVLVTVGELHDVLNENDPSFMFTADEMLAAVSHLETQGYVSRLKRADGEDVVLLMPDVLVNLASSIILSARRHERGLGLIDETRLLEGHYRLPELDELKKEEQRTLIDAATTLFLRRNLCFRESVQNRTCLVPLSDQ